MSLKQRPYDGAFSGKNLDRVVFPLGGIGSGMMCLEGTGKLSHMSLRHKPEIWNEPLIFSAISVKNLGNGARVLEGPVPGWKILYPPGGAPWYVSSAVGNPGRDYGLPRFAEASFKARFPFATVNLADPSMPIVAELTGWSPFDPGRADDSSLPVAALEYRFDNKIEETIEAVFYFNSINFMASKLAPHNFREKKMRGSNVLAMENGFVLHQSPLDDEPFQEGAFCAFIPDDRATVNHTWFRGGWYDALTMVWNDITEGVVRDVPPVSGDLPSPGGTIALPLEIGPLEQKTVRILFAWYVPDSPLRFSKEDFEKKTCDCDDCESESEPKPTHRPWYTSKFANIGEVSKYWSQEYKNLRSASARFSECFYDTTLPEEVMEAVSANMTIIKSPTVLRGQDGRIWAWEGCTDTAGCCPGSCTHVWNYAQAIPHLFPELERTLRHTEFHENLRDDGYQDHRTALPIGLEAPRFVAAADGQLGGIMKVFREWRICGDDDWLLEIWPGVKKSLDYCIETWDPDHAGVPVEPHLNTYDIEFWGPNGMIGSFYLGALKAAVLMGNHLNADVGKYRELLKNRREFLEQRLFNGEYFEQEIRWKNLRAGSPADVKHFTPTKYESEEALTLLKKEGPKYQYGRGCLSDGVLGAWMAEVCGVGEILDSDMVKSHLRSVFRYNFRTDLSLHANPQRPSFATGKEAGLLLCSWPKGGELSLPFVYSNEVWTGVEYQVASHLMINGMPDEGLTIVRAIRNRYDGTLRNPFNEYECGYWYARAMSSYALIQGLTGLRYDAVDKVLTIDPQITGDFRGFLATASGYGTAGIKDARPFCEVRSGSIDISRYNYLEPT